MEWYQWVGIGILVVVIVLQRLSINRYQSMICKGDEEVDRLFNSLQSAIDRNIAILSENTQERNKNYDSYSREVSNWKMHSEENFEKAAMWHDMWQKTCHLNTKKIEELQDKIREIKHSHIAERDNRIADIEKHRENLEVLVQRLRDDIDRLECRHLDDMRNINEQAATIVELESQLAATSKVAETTTSKMHEVHSILCGIVSELQS